MTFLVWKIVQFSSSTEYKIQLQTIFCGKFQTNLSVYWKVYIVISTMWNIQIVPTSLGEKSQGAFHIEKTMSEDDKITQFVIKKM